jgi:hypothetical protein
MRCLDPVDFQEDLEQWAYERCPGTGSWVLEDDNFVSFASCDSSASFFISGSPGSGKTFLMSNLLAYLRGRHSHPNGASLAYFFCDNKVEGLLKRSSLSILKTFTAQLLGSLRKRKPNIVRMSLEAIFKLRQKTQKIPLSQFYTVLTRVLPHFPVTYFVIEALDECDDRKQVLEFMNRLLQDKDLKIKIIISSRNVSGIPYAVSQMGCSAKYELTTCSSTMKADIEQFIDWRINNTDVRDLGADEKARDILIDGSQGLFLLARLRFNALEAQTLPLNGDLKSAVQDLPERIHTYYERAIARLSGADRHLARQIFLWVLFAQVPLSVEELVEATAITPGSSARDEAKRITLRGIEHLGVGLTMIVGNRIHLAHATVKEFATTYQWDNAAPGNFLSQQNIIHGDMNAVCVAYLSLPQLVASITLSKDSFVTLDKQWPLLRYASTYWLSHLLSSTPSDLGIIDGIFNFLRSDAGLAWWRFYTSELHYYNWWSIPLLSSQFRAWAYHNDISRLSWSSDYNVAADLCERHLKTMETAPVGESSATYIKACTRLAEQMLYQGKLFDGERLYNMALTLNEQLRQPVSSETLSAMGSLCQLLCEQGLFLKADKLACQLLSICKSNRALDHRDYISALRVLGDLRRLQHHYLQSENFLRDALSIARKSLGSEDPSTLGLRNALAITRLNLGKYSEAQELLTNISYEAVLGKEHPGTLTGIENVAYLSGLKGNYKTRNRVARKGMHSARDHPRVESHRYG